MAAGAGWLVILLPPGVESNEPSGVCSSLILQSSSLCSPGRAPACELALAALINLTQAVPQGMQRGLSPLQSCRHCICSMIPYGAI